MGSVDIGYNVLSDGEMAVLRPGSSVQLKARTDAIVMLLGGEPVGQRFVDWNFVSSSKDRIEQAKSDWRAGRMKLPDLEQTKRQPNSCATT